MLIRTVRPWLVSLCALLWLPACGVLPQMVERPQLVELPPREVYIDVPSALTAPIAEPASPAPRCDFEGAAAVCVADALASIEDWRGALAAANADRATVRALAGAERSALLPSPLIRSAPAPPETPTPLAPKPSWWNFLKRRHEQTN